MVYLWEATKAVLREKETFTAFFSLVEKDKLKDTTTKA